MLRDSPTDNPMTPGPSCKYIDHVLRILIEEVKPMIKDSDKLYYVHVLNAIKAELELVRESNRQLREVGKYYKKRSK